ncbi:MAG: HAD-IA family hydrolase [Caulobacteraceae bacterium]
MTDLSPLEGRAFAAFLFDMDGTIITSIVAAERVWANWARSHNLDVAAFLPTIHGVRAIDTVRKQNLPGVDAEQEAAAISQAEIEDVDGVEAIAGAARFLAALPPERWAIVTSAPQALAVARLEAAGLVAPALIVSADDVTQGKPSPEGYQLAAERLGVDVRDCLVFEDAPAGIQAGEASGAAVVVVTATHSHPIATPHATIGGYDHLLPVSDAAGLRLRQADFAAAL